MSSQIRSHITDQIIAALSDGTQLPPWRKPWRVDANAGHPTNIVSKRRYSGVNPIICEIAAHRHSLQSKWWGTFRQWSDLGGSVKKRPTDVPPGEWGTSIVYCRPVTKKGKNAEGDDKEDKFFLMKSYTVFNLDQVDGPFDHLRVGSAPITANEIEQRYEHADTVIEATGADIRHGGDKALYNFAGDYIQMPHQHSFDSIECYYETLFHECVHMTEHPTRLNWDRSKTENSYAMGELIAELGGCYLAGELGLPTGETMTNHAAYLKTWLAAMSNDPKFIFKAASQATRAVDYLLSFSQTEEMAEENEAVLVA